MKISYAEIMGAHRAAQALTQNGAVNVPALAALRLARAARVLAQEAEVFDVARVALVKQHASEPDERGNQVVPPERMAEFSSEIGELAKEEIEINVQKITLADFGECQLPMTSLYGMEWLIEG